MLSRLAEYEVELASVEQQLGDPTAAENRERFAELGRRHARLSEIVGVGRQLRQALEDAEAARELRQADDGEDDEAVELEAMTLANAQELEEQMRLLLLPRDPNDDRNVIMEIKGAEGGDEANLWARNLFEMYKALAAAKGWQVEVLGLHESDHGGVTDVAFAVRGDDVWSQLKFEGGPHRVQRVPATESQGRIHTSSATVAVLPEADEVDIEIDPADLTIDTYRSSGPGGQSVNTTDSAVRITHNPTGLVVSMQDEKSQLQNKAKALAVLRSRLLKAQQEQRATSAAAAKRDQVKGGGRSEKIRTYNYKEGRVTDHRISLTLYKLDRVLNGELDEIIDALVLDERTELLAAGAVDGTSAGSPAAASPTAGSPAATDGDEILTTASGDGSK